MGRLTAKFMIPLGLAMLMALSCVRAAKLDPRVKLDPALGHKVTLTDMRERTLSDGSIELQVTGINRSPRRLKVQYSIVYFDTNGFRIDSRLSGWRPIRTEEAGAFTIQSVAPNPAATSYEIKLRKAN